MVYKNCIELESRLQASQTKFSRTSTKERGRGRASERVTNWIKEERARGSGGRFLYIITT